MEMSDGAGRCYTLLCVSASALGVEEETTQELRVQQNVKMQQHQLD